MKIGKRDYRKIKKDYIEIDKSIYDGDVWKLYEHNEYGEDALCIAVNLTQRFYTYTDESLDYTVSYLEDYTLYSMLP